MRAMAPLLVLLACALIIGCDDNPVSEPNVNPSDPGKANQIATAGFQALGDSLETLGDRAADDIRNVRFDDIRDQLESALTYDANNGIAHLGLAIVEILELNYSDEIWEVADSLDTWGGQVDDVLPPFSITPSPGRNMLIGRQFELMATLPIDMQARMALTFPANVSIARVQDIITSTVLPALDRAIGHLNVVEGRTSTEIHIHIDDNGVQEDIVIDLGEILVFSAAVHALRAGFSTATAYDMDLWGPDGTYGWLDDVRSLNDGYCQYASYVDVIDVGGGVVDLEFTHIGTSALLDSIWIDVAHHNLEVRDAFLSLRNGGAPLSNAHADLLGVLDRLEAAADFIRNRTNETEENVIKLADLTDLDADLGDPSGPNFAQGWTRIEDVIDFARDLLNGPMTFNEDLGPSKTPYTFTVDLSSLFDSPIDDWNDLLPYHDWNLPTGAWLTLDSLYTSSWNNGGFSWWEFVHTGPNSCVYDSWSQVNMITYRSLEWSFDTSSVLEFLDGPGGSPIDLKVVRFPYFPDYTFNGLFPNMTRADWLDLIDILDPPASVYLARGREVHR